MKQRLMIITAMGFVVFLIFGTVWGQKNPTPTLNLYEKRMAYLKEHEQEMTDYVKSENPKVENVQWDWDSVEIETIQPDAGGIPTGDKYQSLDIEGGFNNITDSNFVLSFGFDNKTLYPNMKHKSITQPLRIGGNLYE